MLRTSVIGVVTALLLAACAGDSGTGNGPGATGGNKKVTVTLSPMTAELAPGATEQFTAKVKNAADVDVTWSIAEKDGGTVSAKGLYTAPDAEGTYHLVATSKADKSASAKATITVKAAAEGDVSVTISPASASVNINATKQFTAAVANADDTSVTWSVTEGSGGSVNASGLYTAPANAGTYHVVATSNADDTKTATATVTVVDPAAVSVTVSPSTATAFYGDKVNFSATVLNASNTNVTWSVDEVGGGTIASNGQYTAPNAAGTFTVRATSVEDPTKSGTASVTVSAPAVDVWITDRNVTLYPGETWDYSALVTNASPPQVDWTATGGTINNGGTFTAGNTPGTYTITATNVDSGASDTVNVVILVETFAVTLTPLSPSMETGATLKFTATVAGNTFGNPVTWYATAGSIGGTGNYTAPVTPGSYKIIATSKDDTTKKASTTVTVVAANPTITIEAVGSASPETTSTYSVRVAVTNTRWNGWTVSLREADSGSLSTLSGAGTQVITYTTPITQGTYHIDAVTVNLPAKTAALAVAVVAPHPYVNLSPLAVTVVTDASFDFAGDVTGSIYNGYVWSVVTADGGTIDQNGYYTAPATGGVYTVKIASTKVPGTFKTATVTVRKLYCDAGVKDVVFSSQGPDGNWDYGLNDDVTTSYTRYYYTSGMEYVPITYADIGGGWNEYAANNVTMAVQYSATGPDGLWRTDDDVITGVWQLKYDANNRLSWYAEMISGPDWKLGTADDVTGPGAVINWQYFGDPLYVYNPHINWFMSAATSVVQNSEIYSVETWTPEYVGHCDWPYWICTTEWQFRHETFSGAGTDGLWDTGDDTRGAYAVSYEHPQVDWRDITTYNWSWWYTNAAYFNKYMNFSGSFLDNGETYKRRNNNYSWDVISYSPQYYNDGSNYTASFDRNRNGSWVAQSRLRACPY